MSATVEALIQMQVSLISRERVSRIFKRVDDCLPVSEEDKAFISDMLMTHTAWMMDRTKKWEADRCR